MTHKSSSPFLPTSSDGFPLPTELCTCCSGMVYNTCCKEFMEFGNADALKCWNANDFVCAEKIYRAQFVKYFSNIVKHTWRLVDTPLGRHVEQVDVNAVEEVVDSIAACLLRQRRCAEIEELVDRVESLISLPGFAERATYLKSLWIYIGLDDAARAFEILSAKLEIDTVTHLPTLELYVDVAGGRVHANKVIYVIDRMLSLSQDVNHLLQYAGLKAVLLEMLGDRERAALVVDNAIEQFVRLGSPTLDTHGTFLSARLLALHWRLCDVDSSLDKSLARYGQVVVSELSDFGKVAYYNELADLYSSANRFEMAIVELNRALAVYVNDISVIRLCVAYTGASRYGDARSALELCDTTRLDPGLQLEYWHAVGGLAIAEQSVGLGQIVLKSLRRLDIEDHYFAAQRDALCVELFAMTSSPIPTGGGRGVSKNVATILSKYLHLKPNWFGVGININQIIDDTVARKRMK